MRDSRQEVACNPISGLCLAVAFTLACAAIALGQNAQPIHSSHSWEYAVTGEANGPAAQDN